MKHTFFFVALLLIFPALSEAQDSPYPFLENRVSEFPKVRDLALTQDGAEAYFTIQSPLEEVSQIVRVTKENGSWGEAVLMPFSGKYKDLEPFVSPDQKRLYFVSNRPLDGMGEPKDFDIWYVERKNKKSAWSSPVNLGAPINTEYGEFYPSLAKNGNLYFTRDSPETKGKDDVFFAEWKDENYQTPISLDTTINSQGYEYNAFIAPDESYLIFGAYQRGDGYGSGDLYISYRKDGQWQLAENLGEKVNSAQMDYCPFVDPKTGKLYFTSRRSMVEAEDFDSMESLKEAIGQYSDGTSRLYQVDFNQK
ncbi:hypothetical protein [Reichenbachiella ulvae]|uniref:WD40-like Beta Propeller Repeat n=1 Tax=Reichenbachiella ulvae TaxID=2980104 RepID=A0ABT3CTB8_9BACT|nr:hypothetical protein [Reichenbachiella ulvae]MCV9386946.1 hypothetical protein [Reichenbachiella ulvae]